MRFADELVVWLRPQIAVRKQLAEACGDPTTRGTWYYSEPHGETVRSEDNDYVACGPWDGDVDEDFARHMVANDPRATLAECEAHTALLDRHHLVYDEEHGLFCNGCGYNAIERPRTKGSLNHCPTVRAVALAYQHNPGYREEWRA